MGDRLKNVTLPQSAGFVEWDAIHPDFDQPSEDLTKVLFTCRTAATVPSRGTQILSEDTTHLQELFLSYSTYVNEMVERRWQATLMERVLSELRSRVQRLEACQTILVPVETFADDEFDAIRTFFVVVEPIGDEFTATLYDAHVSASGETAEEAVSNLKEMMLATFELLETEDRLGAAMRRQKSVLESIIRRKQVPSHEPHHHKTARG